MGKLPILAYALCLVDLNVAAFDRTGQCQVCLDEHQLRNFRGECFDAIDVLGKRAEIPREVLLGRKEAVASQLNRMLTRP